MLLNEKVKKLRESCEKILAEEENNSEVNKKITRFLDELEYTLHKDIPEADVLMKISSIEKEIEAIHKKFITK